MYIPVPRTVAALTIAAFCLCSTPGIAADLNGEMNNLFNAMGAVGNITQPGAFRGQAMNIVTGGNVMMRAPHKSYQLAAWQLPSMRAGCSGIDLFGGSFSFISKAQLTAMFQNIMAAAPGYFFKLALNSISPDNNSVMTDLWKDLMAMNSMNIDSCKAAQALVNTAWGAFDESRVAGCQNIQSYLGSVADRTDATTDCSARAAQVTRAAAASPDPNIAGQASLDGNIVWKSLKRVTNIDDREREFIMSMTGTVIVTPGQNQSDVPTFETRPAMLTSLNSLLTGDSDSLLPDRVRVRLWRCDDFTECRGVTEQWVDVEPFTVKTRKLMESLSDKIRTRTPPTNQEIGFVNMTTIPVYSMLAAGNAVPGSTLDRTMIDAYNQAIAIDYASTFYTRTLKAVTGYISNASKLNKVDMEIFAQLKTDISDALKQIDGEEKKVMLKQQAAQTIATRIVELQREVRARMPTDLINLMEFSANRVKGYSGG